MKLFANLRGFLRALRKNDGGPSVEHDGHTLAKTMRESTQVGGGDFGGGSLSSTGAQEDIVAKSHKHYTDSLKKK